MSWGGLEGKGIFWLTYLGHLSTSVLGNVRPRGWQPHQSHVEEGGVFLKEWDTRQAKTSVWSKHQYFCLVLITFYLGQNSQKWNGLLQIVEGDCVQAAKNNPRLNSPYREISSGVDSPLLSSAPDRRCGSLSSDYVPGASGKLYFRKYTIYMNTIWNYESPQTLFF